MTTDPDRPAGQRASPLLDPFALLGRWRLARSVDDRLSGQQSRIEGSLMIEAVSPDRLRWEEQGRWYQPGGGVDVRRGLWLVRAGAQDEWWVRFEDDRDFHRWMPGEPVVHPCGPDTYRGLVHGTQERWTVEWVVSGPAKDYSMTTELSARGARPPHAR